MGFPKLVRCHLHFELGPWAPSQYQDGLSRYWDIHVKDAQYSPSKRQTITTAVARSSVSGTPYGLRRFTVFGVFTWWRHQMEAFSALLVICAGNSSVPGESPHKGQWREAFIFSLICVWINGWVYNLEAGDLKRYHAHYDVTVMNMAMILKQERNNRYTHIRFFVLVPR